jgi:hypothetical protein
LHVISAYGHCKTTPFACLHLQPGTIRLSVSLSVACFHVLPCSILVRYIVLCTRIKVHRYHSIIFSIVFSSSQL